EALQFRIFVIEKFKHIFEEVDCKFTPTLPMLPLNINEIQNGWEDTLRKEIKYTSPLNMCGLPALTIPYEKDSKRTPIGIQLNSYPYNESYLINIAHYIMDI